MESSLGLHCNHSKSGTCRPQSEALSAKSKLPKKCPLAEILSLDLTLLKPSTSPEPKAPEFCTKIAGKSQPLHPKPAEDSPEASSFMMVLTVQEFRAAGPRPPTGGPFLQPAGPCHLGGAILGTLGV